MEIDRTAPDELSSQQQISEPTAKRKSSRKRNITIFAVVSIINVALLALLWTQLLTPAANQPNTPLSSTSGLGDASSPLIGKPMPDFTLSTLNGNTAKIHLADFKGKPLVLNFWASWCTPCTQEAPLLQKAVPQLQAQGVVFIGIDGQEASSADALKFMQKYGVNYLNVQDTIDGSTAISYGATGFPETFFINRNGIIVARWAGPLNDKGLQNEIAKINR